MSGRYQTRASVLCCLAVFWKCICRKGQFFASAVMHPDNQQLVILGVIEASWEMWGVVSV